MLPITMARLHTVLPILVLCCCSVLATRINIGPVSSFIGNQSNAGASDGTGSSAKLSSPSGCVVDASQNFYVADFTNNVIRKVAAGTKTATTWLGQLGQTGDSVGTGTNARLGSPTDITRSLDGSTLYVTDFANNRIYSVVTSTAAATYYVGNGLSGFTDGTGTNAQLRGPSAICIKYGSSVELYVSEKNAHRVRKIVDAATSTLAGSDSGVAGDVDATGTSARFNGSTGIAISQSSGIVYLADSGNRKIKSITSTGSATTIAGNGTTGNADGIGSAALFVQPWGMTIDNIGRYLYIADKGNNVIRRLDITNNMVDTVVGDLVFGWTTTTSSLTSRIGAPNGMCFLNSGIVQRLFISGDHSVVYVTTRRSRTRTMTIPVTTVTAPPTTTTNAAPTTTVAGGNGTLAPNATTPSTTRAGNNTGSISAAPPAFPGAVAVGLFTIVALLWA